MSLKKGSQRNRHILELSIMVSMANRHDLEVFDKRSPEAQTISEPIRSFFMPLARFVRLIRQRNFRKLNFLW